MVDVGDKSNAEGGCGSRCCTNEAGYHGAYCFRPSSQGDVLAAARIAGIMAAKTHPTLFPCVTLLIWDR